MHFSTSSFAAGLVTLLLVGCVAGEKSVRPGVNESFLNPKLDPGKLQKRFEGESREVFAHRHRIAAATNLAKGLAVADIGAGTGLFMDLFAKGVGREGVVYAVDISTKLIGFMNERIAKKGYSQVKTVLCSERSVDLRDNSVDVAFVCDTYHHFEYPQSTLTSIRKALRQNGRLVIVDFERIPGKSRDWVLKHVRAGKETVIKEIESAGFCLTGETKVKGLRENYLIHFARN